MSDRTISDDPLVRLYAEYVGPPETKSNAYGYWIFLVGFVAGVLGVLIYLLSPTAQTLSTTREVAFVLAELALPFTLLGIVLMLPVRKSSVRIAGAGFLIALAGVLWFIVAYPANWLGTAQNTTAGVIFVYSVGVAIIAAVAAAVPFATGKQSYLYREEPEPIDTSEATEVSGAEDRDIILGRTLRGALFAVYRENGAWTWRLIDERAIAGSGVQFESDGNTVQAVDTVKAYMDAAGLLEFKHAAFRLHEPEDGGWRWNLVDDHGEVLADGGQRFASRSDAERSVGLLADHGPDAAVLSIDGAAYDVYRDDGYWHWQLIDESRDPLAASPEGHEARSDAESAMTHVQSQFDDVGVLEFGPYVVELAEDGGEWYWRLLDDRSNEIAASERRYDSRSAAEAGVNELLGDLESAPVTVADNPVYEVLSDDDRWYWRFVTATGDVLGRSHDTAADSDTAEGWATEMQASVTDATVYTVEDGAFELYPVGEERWSWRLMDAERSELAEGTSLYDDREDAESAVSRLKELVEEAELIEFDKAAFQLYEADDEWRWRLIDADGNELTDSGEDYFSRDEAASTIPTLKEYAPDADLIEIDTAAFELFRNAASEWNWRLVNEAGQTVAEGRQLQPSRQAARDALDHFIEQALASGIFAMDEAAFQIHPDENDDWVWRFVRSDASVAAVSATSYATQDEAEAAIEAFREASPGASAIVVTGLVVQLAERHDQWHWRVVDANHSTIVTSSKAYAARDAAMAEVSKIYQHGADILVFDLEGAALVVRETEAGWTWELIDEDWTTLARSPGTLESREAAREAADRVRRLAPAADRFDFDTAAFELEQGEEGWYWRLVDEDEQLVARGAGRYGSREEAHEALDGVRGVVGDASVLEIDTAAFEIYHADDGWRWRLIDESGSVLATSIVAYDVRREAREAMRTVQTHGPDAQTAVAQ